jgi:hypothetical protein
LSGRPEAEETFRRQLAAVAHLGELDERGRIEARALARRLIGAPEEASLFNDGSDHLTAPVQADALSNPEKTSPSSPSQ